MVLVLVLLGLVDGGQYPFCGGMLPGLAIR